MPARASAQAGWYLTPSLSVYEDFDDNIFSQPSRPSWDAITRFSPRVRTGFQSQPLTLLGTAGVDAEIFARHPERTGAANRARAGLELRYLPDLTTTLAFNAGYALTETPTELQPQLGLDLGRRTTRQWNVDPSLTHRFDLTTSGDAGYSYTDVHSDRYTSSTQQGRLGLSSKFWPSEKWSIHYTVTHFETDVTGLPTTSMTSHAVTLGWSTKLFQTVTASIDAGPRISDDGTVQPEVSAQISQRFKGGQLAMNYARTQTTAIGTSGTVEVNSGGATLTLGPVRSLELALGVAASYSAPTREPDTAVYRANVSLSYRLTKWLTANMAYRFSVQDRAGVHVYHNIVSVGLEATYPIRAY